jgi:hypothetical protein
MLPAGSKNSNSQAQRKIPIQQSAFVSKINVKSKRAHCTRGAAAGDAPARRGLRQGHSGLDEKDRPQVAHVPRGVYAVPITILIVVWRTRVRVWPVSHCKESGVEPGLRVHEFESAGVRVLPSFSIRHGGRKRMGHGCSVSAGSIESRHGNSYPKCDGGGCGADSGFCSRPGGV